MDHFIKRRDNFFNCDTKQLIEKLEQLIKSPTRCPEWTFLSNNFYGFYFKLQQRESDTHGGL